jgi:hypothetical protein
MDDQTRKHNEAQDDIITAAELRDKSRRLIESQAKRISELEAWQEKALNRLFRYRLHLTNASEWSVGAAGELEKVRELIGLADEQQAKEPSDERE